MTDSETEDSGEEDGINELRTDKCANGVANGDTDGHEMYSEDPEFRYFGPNDQDEKGRDKFKYV